MTMEPAQALIREAEWWLARQVREDPPNSNRGVVVDFCNYLALPDGWGRDFPDGMVGAPWCASWCHLVGRLALGHTWPVPRTPSVQAIAEWAKRRGVLAVAPAPGDLLLIYYARLKRYGHVGIVRALHDGKVESIEGNTAGGGSREGWGVFTQQRATTTNTAFVRWIAAL